MQGFGALNVQLKEQVGIYHSPRLHFMLRFLFLFPRESQVEVGNRKGIGCACGLLFKGLW